MMPFDASPFTRLPANTSDAGNPAERNGLESLSDEVAVRRLFDLASSGAHTSSEFARLDALVYERLLDTYERGAGTAGVIHGRGGRTV